jgi:hypothetical protein
LQAILPGTALEVEVASAAGVVVASAADLEVVVVVVKGRATSVERRVTWLATVLSNPRVKARGVVCMICFVSRLVLLNCPHQ